jgi:hypothetical protein
MTILNAFLIHKSCGGKMTHKNFVNWLSTHKRKMWQLVAFQVADQVQLRCRVCSLYKQTRGMMYFCRKCDGGLCEAKCFEKWPMRVNLVTRHKALTVLTWGKLYCCTARTENICRVQKCCILVCT